MSKLSSVLGQSLLILSAMSVTVACVGKPPSGSQLQESEEAALSVDTKLGTVIGTQAEHGQSFYGIPYAKPPVGSLRWHAPLPFGAWSASGILDARTIKERCPQQTNPIVTTGAEWDMMGSEDCLFLNVHRPKIKPSTPLAVMFWLHGGAFVMGAGDTYDAEQLANDNGVIVVTVNYRLGPLGFLAHPAFGTDADGTPTGNFALQDQVLALTWVRDHIADFGGDPKRLTIFGESAGGYSVCTLLATSAAQGLFQRAIIQSGTCGVEKIASRAEAEKSGRDFAAKLGCSDATDPAECLRALPANRVAALGLVSGDGWNVNAGSSLLPLTQKELFETNQFSHVPVMIGGTHDESRLFELLRSYAGGPLSEEAYVFAVKQRFGDSFGTKVLDTYPAANFATPGTALSAVLTDEQSACAVYKFSANLAPKTPTFVYEFNDPNTVTHLTLSDDMPSLGAYHSGELTYIFHKNWFMGDPAQFTPEQQELATQMASYWTNFAKTGDPNGTGSVPWVAATAKKWSAQNLAPSGPGAVADFVADHHCSLWL